MTFCTRPGQSGGTALDPVVNAGSGSAKNRRFAATVIYRRSGSVARLGTCVVKSTRSTRLNLSLTRPRKTRCRPGTES